ncbi:chitinase-like protein Idgf3 [Calliphora vicina]|uniref:chitinase-like protein Idgf3 n=1 Tax=Calliphora vicina TaxID=7373 RepID=UPI00325A8D54
MKFYLILMAVLAICQMALAGRFNITCYYDTFSIQRGGFANFTENDLRSSFEYCTHVVYGYVGISPDKFDIVTLHSKQNLQFAHVKKLKNQYRHIKFLVSLGGGKDLNHTEKYIKLLEAPQQKQDKFIKSAKAFLRKYKFDGLDLAYQFPHNKAHKSTSEKILNTAKALLSKTQVGQKLTGKKNSKKNHGGSFNIHKQQFTVLANKLHNIFRNKNLMLTLTVLPHVNTSKFINPAVMEYFDFVNLCTFDYSTPQLTHHDADYLAPRNAPPRNGRKITSNIEKDVRQWLSKHKHMSKKLNIGIPTYGRAWRMTKQLKSTAMPIKSSLDGPAPGGELTRTAGLLSWPEMCFKLPKMSKIQNRQFGNYAYRTADVKGRDGLFITYEDRDSLGAKAEFVQSNSLAGVAIFDLTLDDFRGKCKQGMFPALSAIKSKLI